MLCVACQEVVLLLFNFTFFFFSHLHTSYSQILRLLMIGEALCSDLDLKFKGFQEILGPTFLT